MRATYFPWCEACKSYHPIPRNADHHAELHCLAPYTRAEPRSAEDQPKVQVLERHREIFREIISERTKALEDLSDYEFAMSEADGAAIRVIAKYDQSAEIEELKRACLAESTAQQAKINERDGEISALKDEIERLRAEVETHQRCNHMRSLLGDESECDRLRKRVKALEDGLSNCRDFIELRKPLSGTVESWRRCVLDEASKLLLQSAKEVK